MDGIAGGAVIFLIARKLGASTPAAAIAGLLWATCPARIWPLFAGARPFLVPVFCWCLSRRRRENAIKVSVWGAALFLATVFAPAEAIAMVAVGGALALTYSEMRSRLRRHLISWVPWVVAAIVYVALAPQRGAQAFAASGALLFRQRSSLHAHGVEPRTTLIFVGPPGCGKSLTAEALAGELGLGLARVRLAAVVSSFLGETAKNLEQIFAFLRTGSWVLLFDEFDMLARERGDRIDHGEVRRIVSALLQLVEDTRADSMVIATTNHPQLLDNALWRRFDEVVAFEPPEFDERVTLLRAKLGAVPNDVDLARAAKRLAGYSMPR